MRREPRLAADDLESHATEVAVILAESAGIAARAWALALADVREDPDAALRELVTAEIRLEHMARIEVRDALRLIRAAGERLDRELPDDEDGAGDPAAPA